MLCHVTSCEPVRIKVCKNKNTILCPADILLRPANQSKSRLAAFWVIVLMPLRGRQYMHKMLLSLGRRTYIFFAGHSKMIFASRIAAITGLQDMAGRNMTFQRVFCFAQAWIKELCNNNLAKILKMNIVKAHTISKFSHFERW